MMLGRLVILALIFIIVGIVLVTYLLPLLRRPEIIECPKCHSRMVWTPIGTRSENFMWRCLACNSTWLKSYSEDSYKKWKEYSMIVVVRDAVLNYIRSHHSDAAKRMPEKFEWKYEKKMVEGETLHLFTHTDKGIWTVSIRRLPEHDFNVRVEYRPRGEITIPERILWVGIFDNLGVIVELEYYHVH